MSTLTTGPLRLTRNEQQLLQAIDRTIREHPAEAWLAAQRLHEACTLEANWRKRLDRFKDQAKSINATLKAYGYAKSGRVWKLRRNWPKRRTSDDDRWPYAILDMEAKRALISPLSESAMTPVEAWDVAIIIWVLAKSDADLAMLGMYRLMRWKPEGPDGERWGRKSILPFLFRERAENHEECFERVRTALDVIKASDELGVSDRAKTAAQLADDLRGLAAQVEAGIPPAHRAMKQADLAIGPTQRFQSGGVMTWDESNPEAHDLCNSAACASSKVANLSAEVQRIVDQTLRLSPGLVKLIPNASSIGPHKVLLCTAHADRTAEVVRELIALANELLAMLTNQDQSNGSNSNGGPPNQIGQSLPDDPKIRRLHWVLSEMIRIVETTPPKQVLAELIRDDEASELIEETGLADEEQIPPQLRPIFKRTDAAIDADGFPDKLVYSFTEPGVRHSFHTFDWGCNLPLDDHPAQPGEIVYQRPLGKMPGEEFVRSLLKCLRAWRDLTLAPRRRSKPAAPSANAHGILPAPKSEDDVLKFNDESLTIEWKSCRCDFSDHSRQYRILARLARDSSDKWICYMALAESYWPDQIVGPEAVKQEVHRLKLSLRAAGFAQLAKRIRQQTIDDRIHFACKPDAL